MKSLSVITFLIPVLILTTCTTHGTYNIAYKNGFWFDGENFVETTFYSRDGVFDQNKPARIDTTIDLDGSYVIPPFGEAHSHHYESPGLVEAVNELSLKDGVLYGMSMTNWVHTKDEVLPFYERKNTIDVAFADLGLTASYGHPIMVYEHLARGSFNFGERPLEFYSDRRAEGRAYLLFDSVEDVEAKWAQVVESNPDLLKIYLLHTERREEILSDTLRSGNTGLDPEVAAAIVDRAKEEGLRIAAHVETAVDFRLAVEIGVDIIAHLPGYGYRNYPDVNPEIFRITEADARRAAEAGVTVIPTPLRGHSDFESEYVKEKVWEFYAGQLLALHHAGVPLAIGSDIFMATPLQEVLFIHDLNIFSNSKLLRMWGENTAKVIFPERKLGRLQPGYEASFLALECNPLEKFSCIQKILFRVKQGEVINGFHTSPN
jgi:imidazolonepropionase-like amidohydrolase